ncbi:phosphoribulokinase [Thalassobacter stenotrophicus]|uniref:phosphoribulokinase n=1 Tax=Thalassobacter stenotrophicus TaxID=266809 RepID=UPI0022A9324B|nr:phosphoribulokinase [Thalassobacter stenotrophicus]UYP66671.1 phosphoribulokinase [Thalassobacter stenotrophicus]
MIQITPETLVQRVKALSGQDRKLIAIAGAPGSGKSTLAEDLAHQLGPTAAVMPMDGFHLDNDALHTMDLFHRKGAPETFDADGFVALIKRLRGEDTVPYPTFDRDADRTVPDGGQINETTRVVLIEGNYLLLNQSPWDSLAGLFDITVRLVVDHETLAARLITRWIDHGLSPENARGRALGNDMVNVRYVDAHSFDPDYVIRSS